MLLSANDQWLPAFLYLFFSITGGVLAIILGIWSGQRFIKRMKQALAQKIIQEIVVPTLQGSHTGDHVDIDDEVLY